MATDRVRMWRPADEDRVLLMAGRTTRYAIEPRGEYVFGVVAGQPMRSRRGRERRLVRPGQLVAWDPSSAHAGVAVDGRPWSSRLMVVEVGDLASLAGDQESDLLVDVAFPEPVLSDPELTRSFVRLHTTLETSATRLERDERLTEWLRAVIERFSTDRRPRSPLSPRDDRALRLASDYLGERPEHNVGLEELAAAGRHRQVPSDPAVPRADRSAAPRVAGRPPHPRRPPPARSRRDDRPDRRRHRLRRPEPPAPPLPAQPRTHPRAVSVPLQGLSRRTMVPTTPGFGLPLW